MKTRLLFSIFLLPASFLTAQNWSPVNATEAFNFRLDNDPLITTTIRSVSFSANAGDTVFSMRTEMCDSCVTITGGPNQCDTCYAQINLPLFTGRQIIRHSDGWCNFRFPVRKAINLFAALNDSWLFDTTANVTAQVVFAGNATVLGFPDSLKTILLSTGDTIRFSKNYGIVQWPNGYGNNSYYRLIGIHGRNIGELVPRMKDYFDFSPGDIFVYHGRANYNAYDELDFIRKYTITARMQNGDTLRYATQGHEYLHSYDVITWQQSWSNWVTTDTLRFIDSANHVGNYFNNEAISDITMYSNSGSYAWTTGQQPAGTAYFQCQLFTDSLGNDGITYGALSNNGYYMWTPGGAYPTSHADTLSPDALGQGFALVLTRGLGQTYGVVSSNFETYWGEQLTGYVKNGDTVGYIPPDSMFTVAIETVSQQPDFTVYPNPAHEILTVVLSETGTITLLDPLGRTVKSFGEQRGKTELAVSDLPAGVYFLRVETAKGASVRKIVIDR